MNLYDLPPEIISGISQYLSIDQLLNVCETSTYGYKICRDNTLWKNLSKNRYTVTTKPNNLSWYEYFVQLYNNAQLNSIQFDILTIANKYFPEQINFLKDLHNFNSYTFTQSIGKKYIPMPLDSVVLILNINDYKSQDTYCFVGIIDPDKLSKSPLYIDGNGNLYSYGHRGYNLTPIQNDILNNIGVLTQKDPEEIQYTVKLTKLQLHELPYINFETSNDM